MNEQEKQEYLEQYSQAKKKGVSFFPDIIFKDIVISVLVFIVLIALSRFLGAPLEDRANPADTTYTPRPEWYFIFLFQLLKYFPPELEVIGVVVLPTLAILILFILPIIDRNPKRHFLHRLGIMAITAVMGIGVVALTVLSILEAPPPAEEVAGGDQTAALYTDNCSPCHGERITVPPGTNLHEIIAQGSHEGMPAWSADLSSDQIDALVGFILSPDGSQIYTDNCSQCHVVGQLVSSDPITLKNALELGMEFQPHSELEIANFAETLDKQEQTALLNFLIAPDGRRLFTVYCSSCHGQSVGFVGSEEELRTIISQGGMHLEMPPWQEELTPAQIDTLTFYVMDPSSTSQGKPLFEQFCATCHGQIVPKAEEFYQARNTIRSGGVHQTMPVWGNILTDEQLTSLVEYTTQSSAGTSVELGRQLFSQNCSTCHGEFGEGGANPARSGDIIAPISTGEYLKTRDDSTLRAVISQGQPNFGMSPFSTSFGGPLGEDEIDAIVAFLRAWENNPPVELPPEVASPEVSLNGPEVYQEVCAQCHGVDGEGGLGPSFQDPAFQNSRTDQEIFDAINLGHEATSMIGWGEILAARQIEELVNYIRQFGQEAEEPSPETVSYEEDVVPILADQCIVCHGTLGGWDATNYDSILATGDHAPVIVPGDAENSLLAQKIQGTHETGTIMPPAGRMSDHDIQIILDWIAAGAPNN
jgi:mono/diheme cytochrome c family protein